MTFMTSDRMRDLLRAAVDHIESFEEDEAANVFKSLGFTEDELVMIQTEIKILPEDEKNTIYVDGWNVHNGQIYWLLNDAGKDYMFSTERYVAGTFVTDSVPFKNYSHYLGTEEREDGLTRYVAYAWYSKNESYVKEFDNLDEALNWLMPSQDTLEKETVKEKEGTLDEVICSCEEMSKNNKTASEKNEYYKTSDGFFDYYVNRNTGEKKLKLGENDVEVPSRVDDFCR